MAVVIIEKQIRLDKYLADMGIGTRSQVKQSIRKGLVSVNGITQKKPEVKIAIERDQVTIGDQIVTYKAYEYYLLNKPSGVISATKDPKHQTVIDLIEDKKRKDLFPVGRLDKDTEGLLLITNDGDLSHQLLSPKKHVSKVYYAKIKGRVTEREVATFKKGVVLDDGYQTKPAHLKIICSEECSEVELTIYEGKFHQVKRMFESVGMKVTYLKRLSMGPLSLDETLPLGAYRPLTEDEVKKLKG